MTQAESMTHFVFLRALIFMAKSLPIDQDIRPVGVSFAVTGRVLVADYWGIAIIDVKINCVTVSNLFMSTLLEYSRISISIIWRL